MFYNINTGNISQQLQTKNHNSDIRPEHLQTAKKKKSQKVADADS